MTRSIVLLAVLLAGCAAAGATDPQVAPVGIDPTVLFYNDLPVGTAYAADGDTVTMTFYSLAGQTQVTRIAPGTAACIHFTVATSVDSVRFVAFYGDTTGTPDANGNRTPWANWWSGWFTADSGFGLATGTPYTPFWVVHAIQGGFPGQFVSTEPC